MITTKDNGSCHACCWLDMASTSVGAASDCQGDDSGHGIFQVTIVVENTNSYVCTCMKSQSGPILLQDTNGLLPSTFLFVFCFANTVAMQ